MIRNRALTKKSVLTRYAPFWTILLTAVATLAQVVGTRYIQERKLRFTRNDFKSAFVGSILGYFGFGSRAKKI